MRCRVCDYRLWELTSRVCPECGTPFRPSEFEFKPNTVRFCCPHCDQDYYGTDERGHLLPPQFVCARCGHDVHMDEMVLRPTAGVDEAFTTKERMPWLARADIGRLRAWLRTVGMAMVRPGQLIRLAPLGGETPQAWWFAVLTNTLVGLVSLGPWFALPIFLSPGSFVAAALSFAISILVIALIAALGSMLAILLWGASAHGLLRLTGATAGPMSRTCEAICYATGANALTGIPCLGFYIGLTWWLVSAVLMVREGQKVGGGRATIAVIAVPVFSIAAFVALYLMAAFWVFGMARTSLPIGLTDMAASALNRYADGHNNAYPPHGAALFHAGDQFPTQFFGLHPGTPPKIPGMGKSLRDLKGRPESDPVFVQEINSAAQALPARVVAHRVGHFVFTYHGIDRATMNPGLWMVVFCADPGSSPPPYFGGMIGVACVDQSNASIAPGDLPAKLAEQNALRQADGLPPLPDPATVTHDKPAAAGP